LSTNYAYDDAGRLTGIDHQNPAGTIDTLTYGYDPNGNRISITGAGAQPQRAEVTDTLYDEANEALQFDAADMAYDENGNLLSRTDACGTTTYEWDARDRLVGITGFKADCSPLAASFVYDPLGRRVEKTTNGETTMYLYDGLDIIMEMDEMGAPTASYIRTLSIDEPLARVELGSSAVRYYLADALGSVTALADEGGVVKTTYSYDPFGQVAVSGEASSNPFQYTGRENDGTGLYYYRARYYSPELQRFISEDPLGFEGGDLNLYSYTSNSPMNFVDPLGFIRRPQGSVLITPFYCPSNCKEQDRQINSGVVGNRTVIIGPIGSKGTGRILKRPYLVIGVGTRYKLEQEYWLTFVRLACKCKDKCGRGFTYTMAGNEEGHWETIHMWEQTVYYLFWKIVEESQWRQIF
jgi:RHS repeat-associated protein